MAQRQGVALLHGLHTVGEIEVLIKLLQHLLGHSRAHHLHIGIGVEQARYASRMVGFHVMDHQIIGLAAVESFLQLGGPLLLATRIDGVHDGYLVVKDNIRVVTHAFRGDILPLKKAQLGIVTTHELDIFAYFLNHSLLFFCKIRHFIRDCKTISRFFVR